MSQMQNKVDVDVCKSDDCQSNHVEIPSDRTTGRQPIVMGRWGHTPLTPIQGDIYTRVPEIKTITKRVGVPTPFPRVSACSALRNILAPTNQELLESKLLRKSPFV